MGCGGSKEEEGPSVAELEAETAAMPAWAQLNGRRGADATVDAAGYVQYAKRQGRDAPTVMSGTPLPTGAPLEWVVTTATDGYFYTGVVTADVKIDGGANWLGQGEDSRSVYLRDGDKVTTAVYRIGKPPDPKIPYSGQMKTHFCRRLRSGAQIAFAYDGHEKLVATCKDKSGKGGDMCAILRLEPMR